MAKNDHNNGNGKSKFVSKCHICGKLGHIAPNCCFRKGRNQNQYNGGNNNSENNDTNEVTMFCGYSSVPTLTDITPHIEKWLLDSGVTKHMTPDATKFHNVSRIDKKVQIGNQK